MRTMLQYLLRDVCMVDPGWIKVTLMHLVPSLRGPTIYLPFEAFIGGQQDVVDGYLLDNKKFSYDPVKGHYLSAMDGKWANTYQFKWSSKTDLSAFIIEGTMWADNVNRNLKVGTVKSTLDIWPILQLPEEIKSIEVNIGDKFTKTTIDDNGILSIDYVIIHINSYCFLLDARDVEEYIYHIDP